jgi:hypothetical protein
MKASSELAGHRDLSALDVEATLTLAEDVLRRRRSAELDDLLVAAHWAALHSTDPRREGSQRIWSEDRLIDVGGEGSPRVREFCIPELAMVRQVHPLTTQALIADALDLRHRLPRTWAKVASLDAEAWVARKVASMSRVVPLAVIDVVDEAVARIIGTESPSRVLAVVRAKIMEADPAGTAEKAEAERRRRYVTLSRADEHGLRHVIARVTAGDAHWIDVMVDRIADILEPDQPDATTRDERRSIALGWLARPEDVLELLQSATTGPRDAAQGHRKHRERAIVHVHLHEASLSGLCSGVARVEGLGPVALDRLRDLVGHADIIVQPVLDLADRIRLSSYEHPTHLKDRVRLITDGDRFPYSGAESPGADFDHPTPFDRDGPPGQTGTHNSSPLGRRHHRWKTHAGYTSRQCGDGRYVWRTPHARYFLVDHTGTRPLDRDTGALIHEAPPGVDVYVPGFQLIVRGATADRRPGARR